MGERHGELDIMKKGEMYFSSDSYMSFHAVLPDSEPTSDSVDSFMINWADADEFANSLRRAADFIDKYKDKCAFDVHID